MSQRTGGHFGIEKSYSTLKLSAYWPGMSEESSEYRNCVTCQKNKDARNPTAPLGEIPIGEPWEPLSVDILKVSTLTEGKSYLLVVQDHFSKYLCAVAMRDQTAKSTTDAFVQICSFLGLPRRILSDQGTQFESKLMQETLQAFSILKTRTTAYNQKCNGQVERGNKSILQLLRCFTEDEELWEEKLLLVLLVYNSTIHSSMVCLHSE